MLEFSIRRMANGDAEFYPIMGPFLGRRSIVAELGFPVWDDDGKAWYVAMSGDTVVGFASMSVRNGRTMFQSDYTLPEYRGQGVYNRLIVARLADVETWPVVAVATPASAPLLARRGFIAGKARGRYVEMTNAGPLMVPA